MYDVQIEQGARDAEAYADDDAKIVVRLVGDVADTRVRRLRWVEA